jgi:beta-glucosidase
MDSFGSRCYGVESLTEAQRHLLAIENGVDQFGGNSDMRPILEAYQLGCQKYGEETMRARMEQSAVRLLRNIFRCGLFENPYLDPEESAKIVGCETFAGAGYQAQLKSVVMVKNRDVLPVRERRKVYIPSRKIKAKKNFFRGMDPEKEIIPVTKTLVEQYYDWAETPEEADFALVFIESPLSDGYSREDAQAGGNGYVPVSLQYRPYIAEHARKESIAGGDFRENFRNRSYFGKKGTAANEGDLDLVLDTKAAMGDKPVIVCLRMHNPTVLSELEPYADGIFVDFGVQTQAIFDLVCGNAEPSGLLPVEFPANMETVERHCEDVPFDMETYVDQAGNAYQYAFGLNWSGRITDSRTERYPKK